jgi:hypothetical protein
VYHYVAAWHRWARIVAGSPWILARKRFYELAPPSTGAPSRRAVSLKRRREVQNPIRTCTASMLAPSRDPEETPARNSRVLRRTPAGWQHVDRSSRGDRSKWRSIFAIAWPRRSPDQALAMAASVLVRVARRARSRPDNTGTGGQANAIDHGRGITGLYGRVFGRFVDRYPSSNAYLCGGLARRLRIHPVASRRSASPTGSQ